MVNHPHEVLDKEMQQTPKVIAELRDQIATRSFPDAYFDHPVVKQYEAEPMRPVMPCALFLDGVPFTKRDGLLGIVVYSLISFKRHLLAVFRKSNMCKCGCRGWCSLWPVFDLIRWSFAQLARGS